MKEEKNIFERVAETTENLQHKAFLGNESSKQYLNISFSTEPKEVGNQFPQTNYIDLSIAHSLKFDEFPKADIKFNRIELYKSAKLTDVISTAAISAHAFILSNKGLRIFEKFNLGNHKIYPANVFYKGTKHEFYVLHFINDLHKFLDFKQSKFYVANILGGYAFDIDIDSEDDYESKRQLVKNGQYPETKDWWYVRLKWGVFRENISIPDIFNIFSSNTQSYISKDLGMAILKNELTGFSMDRVYNLANS